MPKLRLGADARQGVKAFDDLNKAIGETEEQLKTTAREARKLENQAKRIVDSNLTPQERYNKLMKELAAHVKSGRISMEHAERQAKKLGEQLNKATKSGDSAFGQNLVLKLGTAAGGVYTLSTAVNALSAGFQKAEQDAQKAADSIIGSLGAIGELQQVSKTPEEFQKNLGFARSLVRRGVFSDIGEAADFAFATTSAGYSDAEKEYLAGIGARKQVRSGGLTGFASGARKVQGLFGGASLQEAGDKLLAASGFTQANLTQTAEAVPKLTAFAKALGYDPDAVLAGLVANEEAAANIDVGATQYASFLTQVSKRGLSTGTLEGTVESIQKRLAAGENIYSILGEEGAVKGFSALVNERGEFNDALGAIKGSGGALASRDFLGQDPETAAAALQVAAEGKAADAQRPYATAETLYRAIQAEKKAQFLQDGDRFSAYLGETVGGWVDAWGGERSTIAEAAYDETLPLELRLQSARYARDTAGDQWRTSATNQREFQQLDRMIQLLEQQLQAQQSQQGGTKQEGN